MSKRPENRYPNWEQPIDAVRTAFNSEPHPVAIPVNDLLEQAASRHRKDLEQRLAEEAEQRRLAEENEIDRIQDEEIVNKLRVIIDQLNEGTEGPKASMQNNNGNWSLMFPYASSATLSFFPANPPLQLSPFTVRHVALLADAQGCGFNLLLQRRANDIYGEWVVCRVRYHPLSEYRHPYCKYFGLDRSKVEYIERGHRSSSLYVPEISSDVDTKLAEFVRSLY
jgi:hypothetical protein